MDCSPDLGKSLTPVFVIGVHRSGTTWVANALCNHSRIFGVQSQEHMGIVESWFFSHLDGRFGDLQQPENYLKFQQAFFQTAFFKDSGVPEEAAAAISPADYAFFFDRFMHLAAKTGEKKASAACWLEKTPVHTLYLDRLISHFPGAKFVVIERRADQVVRSAHALNRLKAANRPGSKPASILSLVKTALHWHKYHAFAQFFAKKHPGKFFRLQYDLLLEEPQKMFQNCVRFLDLDWENEVLKTRFQQNTSFPGEKSRDVKSLTALQHAALKTALLWGRLIPFRFYRFQENRRVPRNQLPVP